MTEIPATKGLRLFGKWSEKAIIKEFKQLAYTENVFEPKQRHLALRAIIFVKEKQDGKVKSRTIADGIIQREYIPVEN